MTCLDTDFWVGLLRGNPEAIERLRSLAEIDAPISTTIITVCELYKGACLSKKVEQNKREIESKLRLVNILDLSEDAAKTFGELMLELSGREIGDLDTLIASICLANNEALITNDEHFYRIPDLSVEGW